MPVVQAVFPELSNFTVCIVSEIMMSDCLSEAVMCLVESVVGLSVETVAREGTCKKFYCILTEYSTCFPRLPLVFVMEKRRPFFFFVLFCSAIATEFL